MITPAESKQLGIAVHTLREFFENVQIMVSRQTDQGTEHITLGMGDWFARRGLAQYFLDHGKAHDDAEILKQHLNNNPE